MSEDQVPATIDDDPFLCYLVVVTDGQKPYVEQFATLPEMGLRIKELQDAGEDTHVFPFFGWRLLLTKPPFRFLTKKGMDPIPCFEVPKPGDPDPDGRLEPEPVQIDSTYQQLISKPPHIDTLLDTDDEYDQDEDPLGDTDLKELDEDEDLFKGDESN